MRRKPFEIENSLDSHRNLRDDTQISFEESILDEDKQEDFERMSKTRPRLQMMLFFAGIIFVILLGKLYYLTVVEHEHYLAVAEGNRLRIEYIPAPRGAIYDRQKEVIAGNKPNFELAVIPLDLPDDVDAKKRVIDEVSGILDASSDEILKLVETEGLDNFQSVTVKRNLTREQALIFYERIRHLPGFRIVNAPIRDYHFPEQYAHLIGYVGKLNQDEYQELRDRGYLYNDSVGKTNLEIQYESFLRGVFGERQIEVDASGVVKKVYGEKEAIPGDNLILNIDAGLQAKLYDSLTSRLEQIKKKKAAAIAMNPKTGEILAFLSLPSFDNNLFAEGISFQDYQRLAKDPSQPLFNRAIRGVYPPGSTVKTMVAAAALQEGVIDSRTVIDDRGYIVIRNIYGGPDSYFYGYNRRALGPVDVWDAIAKSSDVFFYIVGGGYSPIQMEGLGIDRLAKYYKMFKIDEQLGIDLPGERTGLVPTPEWKKEYFGEDNPDSRWYLGNTYHVSIGQGDLLVNPLHVLSWTATIANDGKIMKPYLVDRIESIEGDLIENHEPEQIGEIQIDQVYLDMVKQGMRQTVIDGTAKLLSNLSIEVAGKTGSAQFDANDLGRSHAWFVGYAPYDDPQIALMILIEDGGTGAGSSVPVAREVFEWWQENRLLR